MVQVADGVFRLGSAYVGFYVLEEGGRLTVVDAGLPRYWDRLTTLLGDRGWSLEAVEAVLLTHAHPDHTGLAERLRTAASAPVYVHPEDAAMARGTVKMPPPRVPIWRPAVLRTMLLGLRGGVLRVPPVTEVATLADGDTLDLPGAPRVIHAPGHTAGSCALLCAGRDVLFSGDVLATVDILTGRPLPSIPPGFVNEDSEQALASLARLDGVSAGTLLPGHGDPWRGGVAEALRIARDVGVR